MYGFSQSDEVVARYSSLLLEISLIYFVIHTNVPRDVFKYINVILENIL